jgi:hypothetical protein
MRNLSKSKVIALRQCPKRLWQEIQHKEQLRQQLHECCKLDTLTMVRLWEVFRGISENNLES